MNSLFRKFTVFSIVLSMLLSAVPSFAMTEDTTVEYDFQDAEIRQVFSILAEVGGFNYIADTSVTGKATFTLKGLSVKKAIDLVARTSGLGYLIVDNTLIVASPERIKTVFSEQVVDVVNLKYASANYVLEALGRLHPEVVVLTTQDGKSLLLRANAQTLEQAKETIAFLDRPSSLDMASQEEDLAIVIQRLAQNGGFNVIIGEGIKGRKVTAVLQNADPKDAVDMLADHMDLVTEWKGETLLVRGNSAGVAMTEDGGLEPIYVKTFQLSYSEPEQIDKFLDLIIPDGQVEIDKESRVLAVKGTRSQHDLVERLIASFDQAPAQVFIEARVQEVSRDTMRNLGVDWTYPQTGQATSSFGRLSMTANDLTLMLEALENKGYSQLLATPQITTINGKTASIFIGDRVPVILEGRGDAQDTIEYIEAGITLEITPYIAPDGSITTEVRPEVASIASWTAQEIPQIRTRKAETTVRVRDGQPIVIGGLIKQEDRDNMETVPFLGDLPILSQLFGKRRADHTQMETVIFLIPHIVTDEGGWAGQDGTEWMEDRTDKINKLMKDLEISGSADSLKFDVAGVAQGSLGVEFERSLGEDAGAYTKLVRTPVTYGSDETHGLILGVGGRAYYDTKMIPLWASLGVEGLWIDPEENFEFTKPYTLVVSELGLSPQFKDVFFEPHIRWSHIFSGENDVEVETPGYGSTTFGLRAGYRF